jgi:hypothetical protein
VEIPEPTRSVLKRSVCTALNNAPTPVYRAVAALVDPEDIQGSWAMYRSGADLPKSQWICWVVTSNALAEIEVEFDSGMYDEHAEEERIRDGAQLPIASLNRAWKRPLREVIELRIGAVPIDGVHLRFADKDLPLPVRPSADVEGEIERFEYFIDQIWDRLQF